MTTIITDKSLKEIFTALVGCDAKLCGALPSDNLLKELAQATGKSVTMLKEEYKQRYQEITERDDDPFYPPSLIFPNE